MVTGSASPRTRGFNCSNCGGAVELRALAHTRAVTCTTCGALLDPRDPNLVILQEAARRESITPAIPLGTRGTWHGHPYEVIGFQRRSIDVEGTRYSWDEYVLFNPYQGFRYLSEYQGHWNDIRTVRELPSVDASGSRPTVSHAGRTYKHFQRAQARTDYVLGEFPWRVRTGDVVEANDYVDPPFMLSSETTAEETTWSRGEYTPGAQIWKAFALPGEPPEAIGVFANQPNPHSATAAAGCTAFLVLAGLLVVLFLGRLVTADREQVFTGRYAHQPGAAEPAFVTPTFTLREAGTLAIDIVTGVQNNWIGFDLALIDLGTGTAYNVAAEAIYYSGVEGGEGWSEGSREANVFLRQVAAGEYYLRVEPEAPAGSAPVAFAIRVTRDVPSKLPYLFALFALLLLPLITGYRSQAFETRRMQESDYGSSGSDASSSDDESDDDE